MYLQHDRIIVTGLAVCVRNELLFCKRVKEIDIRGFKW